MASNLQIVLALAVSLVVGFLAGHFYGSRLSEPKKFYKYPSSHWRIRKR